MKTIVLSFLLCFVLLKTQAQNYQISFSGTGASTSIDSVKVENLTQATTKYLKVGDILHLSSTVGIHGMKANPDKALHVYPNPMNGTCSIDFDSTAQGKMTVELYSISEKRILQQQEFVSKGHQIYWYSVTYTTERQRGLVQQRL